MKIVRRIIAIILLVLLGLTVGYLCFTGSQLENLTSVALVGGSYV